MPYRWAEHTGEVELEIVAPDEVAGRDRAALLADWLAEIAILGETESLVPQAVSGLTLDDGGLRATVEGRRGEPAHLVKGATYHRLAFERSEQGWFARVVLDV